MFFPKSDIEKQQKPPAGMLVTEVRSGDAPKPPVSMKTNEKKTLPGMHHTEVRGGDAPKPPFSIKTNNKLEKILKSGFDQPFLFLSLF